MVTYPQFHPPKGMFINVNNFIFLCSACILIHMEYTVDTLSYDLNEIEEGRIRIVVKLNEEVEFPTGGGVELGTLYFEKAKKIQ